MDAMKEIPENKTGIQTNTESKKECASEEAAKQLYQEVKERLLRVSQWKQWAGTGTAEFTLTDAKGIQVMRVPIKGDHFMIDIPAPGPDAGDGHDWVAVESVIETDNSVTIQVRPCPNPRNEDDSIAHFFSASATSSFTVKREGNTVIAGVYGRNEKPNLDTETLKDKFRNTAIAGGAIGGFSKIQWKALVDGLVEG